MDTVHLSGDYVYILEVPSGAVTVISPPTKSLPYTPRELELMKYETASAASSARTSSHAGGNSSVATSVRIIEDEEEDASGGMLLRPSNRFRVGDKVDIQRNSGKWVEGVVVKIKGGDTVYVQYFAAGAKFQKKLHVSSECLACYGTKVRRVTFGVDRIRDC